MLEPLQYGFFQRALVAGILACIACGIMGSFVVVRRIASLSGGLSHAAFGGVGLGYALGFDPMLGATAFALGGATILGLAQQRLTTGMDTLIAMLWSAGMALGILLIALTPGYAPDLMSYLFGSILFVPAHYVLLVLGLDVVVVAAVLLLFRELRAVAFDEEFATVLGLPVTWLRLALLALTGLSIVTLIRVVGVILVIALLTVPAAIARQWTESLGKMMALAVALGAICTTSGLYLAYYLSSAAGVNAPSGPLIILLALLLFGVSSLVRLRRVRA